MRYKFQINKTEHILHELCIQKLSVMKQRRQTIIYLSWALACSETPMIATFTEKIETNNESYSGGGASYLSISMIWDFEALTA